MKIFMRNKPSDHFKQPLSARHSCEGRNRTTAHSDERASAIPAFAGMTTWVRGALLVFVLALAACASVGPDYHAAKIPAAQLQGLEAAKLRLRPILMTSIAFIMGVVPLVTSSGAGAEMRHAMGGAVFSGMLGVTIFGLIYTPLFYVVIRALVERREARAAERAAAHAQPALENH
jgi:uncharacterized protein YqgC (DUF456 family)